MPICNMESGIFQSLFLQDKTIGLVTGQVMQIACDANMQVKKRHAWNPTIAITGSDSTTEWHLCVKMFYVDQLRVIKSSLGFDQTNKEPSRLVTTMSISFEYEYGYENEHKYLTKILIQSSNNLICC